MVSNSRGLEKITMHEQAYQSIVSHTFKKFAGKRNIWD